MNRRAFLRNGLWLLGAPTIIRAGVLPSSRRIATPMAPAAAGYTAYASVFDGTNDYAQGSGSLTSGDDGTSGMVSLWIKFTGGDATLQTILSNGRVFLNRTAANKFQIKGYTSAFVKKLDLVTTNTYVVASGWLHVGIAWDLVNGLCWMTVNGASDLNTTTLLNATLDYDSADLWTIGAEKDSSAKTNAELCEVYIGLNQYMAADETKWASASKPISLGTTGSLVTGTSPTVYYRDPYTSFGTDRSGNANNMTVTGALTQGTPP